MTVTMNMIQTIGLAVIVLLIGKYLRKKVNFFQKFAIPAPVIGGLLFAIINLILNRTGALLFEFDTTLQSFFMIIFFTSIGFNASFKILKAGGKKVIIFLGVAVILCILQNAVALGLSGVVGLDPKLALMTGSTPMTGGHGTAAGIAPLIEAQGITQAPTVAIAAATFGLLAGSLMGGPVANRLIIKNDLVAKRKAAHEDDDEIDESLLKEERPPLDGARINMAFFLLLIAMGVGVYLSDFINYLLGMVTNVAKFPAYIGPMILAIIMRNTSDRGKHFVPVQEVQIVGEVGLNLFLAMALMTLRLWDLIDLAGPLVVLLAAQAVLMFLFAYFVTFRIMGSNYDAAVLTAGHCGFGMGATPNGVANMDSVCEKFVYSRLAFFVLPIVGGMFIDFFNIAVISIFMSFT